MIEFVEDCFAKSELFQSKISQDIKDLEGMTGEKTRHLYNNLASMKDARILEIGCWKGSSSCSFMFGNAMFLDIIDDFSGFGSPVEECKENIRKFTGDNAVKLHQADCFTFDLSNFDHKFNIYLYDSDHSSESQFRGIDYYLSVLEDAFILIVDDANWPDVRIGTERAIKANNLQVIYHKEIRTSTDDSFCGDAKGFWNGISVFVLKK